MPIYTVREVTGDQKPHPDLIHRGLSARVVTMTQLDPIAVPDYPQVAYHLYSKLLPAFMLATKNDKTYPTTYPGYNLVEKFSNSVRIPLPPLTVTFNNKLASEEIESLKTLGAGVIPNKDETQIKYTFGASDVTLELIDKLFRHNKKVRMQNACPAGSVNLATMQSLFRVCGIMTWFLKTHVYPAYDGPVEDGDDSTPYDCLESFISLKRKAQEQLGPKGKKRATEGEEEEEVMDTEEDFQEKIESMMFGDEVARVPKAKPSVPPRIIAGSYEDAPTLPGLVFPYFEGMIADDTSFVSGIIRTYFLECLGDTREAILTCYKDLKLHMGILASTATGRILQHIFLGIKLAIDGQARLYVVKEGPRYTGFTLHGWYFTVSIDGYKHKPLEHLELVKEAKSIDSHNVALASIVHRLSKLKLIDTRRVMGKERLLKAKNEDCKTPRGLAAFIRSFDMDESEKDEIEKLAVNLSFPQRFWTIDNKTIIKAVDLLLAEEFPPLDTPMYMRGGTLTTDSSMLSTFALFGDQAFSLRLTGGQPKKVPKDITSDVLFKPYRGKNNKEVIPKPNFVIAKKSHSLCIEDWKAFLLDHLVITKQSRDAMFRSVVLGGDRAKDFWYELIKRVGPIELDITKTISGDALVLGDDVLEDHDEDFSAFL